MRCFQKALMGSLRNVGARTSQVMNWARIQAHCSRNLTSMQMEINGPLGRDMDTVDIRMAPPVPIVRPPIRSYCPLQAKLAGSITTTWKRCWHLSCIDFGNGHHFSHSMLCPVNPAQRPCFYNQSPSPTEYPVDLLSILTRMVRHRMRGRYGGSRGGRARPHTAQSSARPSPPQDQEDEAQPRPQLRHYSYARSRRGRGMESRDPLRDFGLHSVISQQSPGSASHTTHFRLHSRLNKPTITAKVTVVFTEEEMLDSDQVTSSKEHSQGMRAQDMRGVRRKIQRMIARESGIAKCNEHVDDFQRAGGCSAVVALTVGCAGRSRGAQQMEGPNGDAEKSNVEEKEDDWEQYVCPVVEETPKE